MNIIKRGSDYDSGLFSCGYHKRTDQTNTAKFGVMTGATVMAQSIKIFVQVTLLSCVVTTSMGGITDLQKSFSELENNVKVSQEEIKSLHLIIEQLEKRLEQLEVNGEFGEVQIQPAVPTLHAC